jgi:hypothetical protein
LSEAQKQPPPPGWEVVAEVAERYEAELLALRLRDAGFEPRVVDLSFRQEPLPAVRSFAIVRVYVSAAHAQAARRLLAEMPAPLEPGDGGEP